MENVDNTVVSCSFFLPEVQPGALSLDSVDVSYSVCIQHSDMHTRSAQRLTLGKFSAGIAPWTVCIAIAMGLHAPAAATRPSRR